MNFPLLHQGKLHRRESFGEFLNRRKLCGIAVEVGTHRGDFAACLLQSWQGNILYCVDHWLSNYDPTDPAALGDRESDYRQAIRNLRRYKGRYEILHKPSDKAVSEFSNSTLDFVYIDALHTYEAVLNDLRLWWPKVRGGGILAGHDFVCPGEAEDDKTNCAYAVQGAVIEFCQKENINTIWMVVDLASPWSFYLRKPK